ncbi:AraC family transcriptional regulator [Megalodesulfovibrio paquesii]
MDPLSDVLSLLKPRSSVSAGFDAGGEWAIRFGPQHGHIKCYAVVTGQCWLTVESVPDPVLLRGGDCFVLPGGRPFWLGSGQTVPAVEAGDVFPPARAGGVVVHNGGGDFFLVGSRFAVQGDHTGLLLRMLPPIVHIRQQSDQAALRWAVERMMLELREQRPGCLLVAQHLAHMMLIQALRLHMAEQGADRTGWLFALADRQLGTAIASMHQSPALPWTVQKLATVAGMSRSTFALKFKAMVGLAPMEYLTRWRMLLAGDRLAQAEEPVAVIAESLGYASESAFSLAFKRVMGRTPREYGRSERRSIC